MSEPVISTRNGVPPESTPAKAAPEPEEPQAEAPAADDPPPKRSHHRHKS